jgi:hypothetical protein
LRRTNLFWERILAQSSDQVHANGDEMPRRDVLRLFGRKQRSGYELERALTQLKKEERIDFCERSPPNGGRAKSVIVLVGD